MNNGVEVMAPPTDALAHVMEAPESIPDLSSHEVVDDERAQRDETGGGQRSVASQLIDLAREQYSLGVTPEGETYALPADGGHVVTMLRDNRSGLRMELAKQFFQNTSRAASSGAQTDAMAALEGFARGEVPVEAHLRTASHGDAVYLDLGDTANSVVRVTSEGWQVIRSDVPVRFRRTRLTGAFPMPERGGCLDDLWPLLNVDDGDRVLLLAYMVAALIQPDVPHPVLAFFAEQGSGKSTACRLLVDLVDPSAVPLRKAPRDSDSWVVAASGSWVVALDNLSTVPDWLSDALCRASTGEGDVRRALYTDAGLSVVKFRRCIIANGIDVGALRGDLSERLLCVPLYPIRDAQRQLESAMWGQWRAAYPRVLGSLLDLCAATMASLHRVEMAEYPRMADFARVLAAVDQVLGTDGLKRYLHHANSAAVDSLSADPFIARVREVITEPFMGTAAELLTRAQPLVPGGRRTEGWPRNARDVTTCLKRNAPALRRCGWDVSTDEGRNQNSTFRWSIQPPLLDSVLKELT